MPPRGVNRNPPPQAPPPTPNPGPQPGRFTGSHGSQSAPAPAPRPSGSAPAPFAAPTTVPQAFGSPKFAGVPFQIKPLQPAKTIHPMAAPRTPPKAPPVQQMQRLQTPATSVRGEIIRQALLHHIPPFIALAVAQEESGFNQSAVSPAGAIGVMQLMPATAQGLGVDPNNWRQNIRGGVSYLAANYRQYGNWTPALRDYNGGPNWASIPSTANYAQTVLAISNKYKAQGPTTAALGDKGLIQISQPLPGNAVITSGWGPRLNPITGVGSEFHPGVDIAAPMGTPIHAMVSGKAVLNQDQPSGGGNYLAIEDRSGRVWWFMHMEAPSPIKVGSAVKAGEPIGNVGSTGRSTGPHLYIQLTMGLNGKAVNPSGVINKAYALTQYGNRATVSISAADLAAPGNGGPNVIPGPAGGFGPGGAPIGEFAPLDTNVQRPDFASVARPANANMNTVGQEAQARWLALLQSGQTSPETKALAQQAGVNTDPNAMEASVLSSPVGTGLL